MKENLTNEQLKMLLHLVRKEARYNGYNYHWFSDNQSQWPRRLKKLRVIAEKLRKMIDE